MRAVKTDWQNRLNESNLTDLLRIKVTGPTLHGFKEEFCDFAVSLRNNDKRRRPNQAMRKASKNLEKSAKRTREMERDELLKTWLVEVGANDTEDSDSQSDEREAMFNIEDT